jgi:hypothetical protein
MEDAVAGSLLPRLPGFIGLRPVVAHTLLLRKNPRRATVDIRFTPESCRDNHRPARQLRAISGHRKRRNQTELSGRAARLQHSVPATAVDSQPPLTQHFYTILESSPAPAGDCAVAPPSTDPRDEIRR